MRKDASAKASGISSINESEDASTRGPTGGGATGKFARKFRKTTSPFDMMYDSDPDSDCLVPMFSCSRAKASPQAPAAFKRKTDAPPSSTTACGESRQTRHPPRDGGDGVGKDSKDSSGSEFEGIMFSSRLFSPRREGLSGCRGKNNISSAGGDSGKQDARTNGDNINAPEGSRGVAEREAKAHGGKRKQSGRLARRERKRFGAKKSRRAGGVACASGEYDDVDSANSDFSSSNGSGSSGSSTSSTNGDAPERANTNAAKGKATDWTKISGRRNKRSISAAAPKPSPESCGESSAGAERGETEDEHRRGDHDRGRRAATDKCEDLGQSQGRAADSRAREAHGVGDRTDRRGRKQAHGNGAVQRGFDDTSDGSGDSADCHRRPSGDGICSGNGSGNGRFDSNGAVGRRHRNRKGDDDDDEEEEDADDDVLDDEKLKPTLSNPPFEDPEMRPLVLENEEGGERAEVPAAVNRYLRGFQRDGVRYKPLGKFFFVLRSFGRERHFRSYAMGPS